MAWEGFECVKTRGYNSADGGVIIPTVIRYGVAPFVLLLCEFLYK